MRFNSPRQILHQHLECGWHIAEPKGHVITFKNPKLPTVKAVYCFDAPSIFIRQNLDLRSRQEKVLHLPYSPMPPGSWAEGRSPFLCACLGGKSRCRILSLHPT